MALNTRTRAILKLPELTTSRVRELQWGMDWWEMCFKEAKAQEEVAIKVYCEAIDNGDSKEEIDTLFIVCKMFEANRIAAWQNWQECKRQYLEMMN